MLNFQSLLRYRSLTANLKRTTASSLAPIFTYAQSAPRVAGRSFGLGRFRLFVRQPWLGWQDTAWPGYTSANGSDQPLGSFKAVYAKRATVVLREPNRISICVDCRYQQIVEDGVVVSTQPYGDNPSIRKT